MPTQRFAITNLLISDMKNSLQVILVIAIMCGSIGGIVVASILKLLDNIVKVCLQMQDLLSWDDTGVLDIIFFYLTKEFSVLTRFTF